ncbi:MAG: LysR family transcriptional regulator [Clostridiales bacterium]|nr:LysR family transcriptional regulator [Clostridiales bacterium]
MNMQQLETFIQVAENLNFARAAEALNLTQSAVSRQIHSLEEELGAKLLSRTTRAVTLTPAGISFLADSKKMMNTLYLAKAKIQEHTEADIQTVSFGCGNIVELDLFEKVLQAAAIQFPEVHPFLKVVPHPSILSLFLHGEIDILAGFRDDISLRKGVVYRELARIPLCCVFSEEHPYSDKKAVSEAELYSEHIIICNEVPSKATDLQNRVGKHIPLEYAYICENLVAALAMVRAGYGFTIMPKSKYDRKLCYIPVQNIAPLSYGVFYKSDGLTALMKDFISIIESVAEDDTNNMAF